MHKARKRFGQHFLHDISVIESIVRAIDPQHNDSVIEIGPGLSALTKPLLARLKHLTAIEIDRDLAARLSNEYSPEKLSIICADVLEVDFAALGDQLRIVGNLPYNISSPLLFHLVGFANQVRDQHFMLQREVVTRMIAAPATPDYGRLSVMLQARYRMYHLFDVQPEAFDPPPRVISAIVKMVPLPHTRLKPDSEEAFAQVVAKSFSQRRKMLRRVLANWAANINWDAVQIPQTARAEELSVEQFILLSNHLHKQGLV